MFVIYEVAGLPIADSRCFFDYGLFGKSQTSFFLLYDSITLTIVVNKSEANKVVF